MIIFKWPYSYWLGLMIGLGVTCVVWKFDPEAFSFLTLTGTRLFLGGWVLIIAATFADSMRKFFHPQPVNIWHQRILKLSVILGFAGKIIPFMFFKAS